MGRAVGWLALATCGVVGCSLGIGGLLGPPADGGGDGSTPEAGASVKDSSGEVGEGGGRDGPGDAGAEADAPDACPVRPPGDGGVVVATPASNIVIDGKFDDWVCPETRPLTVNNAGQAVDQGYTHIVGPDAGSFPIRANYAVAWDSANLYFAIRVQDQSPDDGQDAVDPFKNDAVEVYLSSDPMVTGAYGDHDHQYVVDYKNLAVDYGPATAKGDNAVTNPAELASAVTVGNGFWQMEARVSLMKPFGVMTVMPGKQQLRFDLEIDDDVPDDAGGSGSETNVLVWHVNDGAPGDCMGLDMNGFCCAGMPPLVDQPSCDNAWFGWILPVTP